MKKLIATITIVLGLGAGAFALNTVLPAGAQTAPSTPAATTDPGCGHHVLKDALAGLVQNGTLTQAQSDAVVQAVQDTAKTEGRGGAGHPRARIVEGAVKVAADTIGVTPQDLVQARQSGKSIADVANEHNVNPTDVVNAIVTAGNQKIDSLVTAGTITPDQASKAKARLPQMADKLVNHTPTAC